MRIEAGKYKGRVLLSPPAGSITRPITARAKKSLFAMLADWMPDGVVADLYCGTGSMGIEALSRGARLAAFAEKDRRVLANLRKNIETIGATDDCRIWPGDVTRGLARRLDELGSLLDVAFLDPPYAALRKWDWPASERMLFAPVAAHLADDGVVVLRLPNDAALPEGVAKAEEIALAGLACKRVKTFGDMVIAILGRAG